MRGRIHPSSRSKISKALETRQTHLPSSLHAHKSEQSEMATSSSILALTTWPLSIELTQLWILTLGIIAIIYPRRAVCNTLTPFEMASINRLMMRSTGNSNLCYLQTIIKLNTRKHHSKKPVTSLISGAKAKFSLNKKDSLQLIYWNSNSRISPMT